MRAATPENNSRSILRYTKLYPPHHDRDLYYEISCCFRNGQNLHIFTYFFKHRAMLQKCTSSYILQPLTTFLTISKQNIISIVSKIRKIVSNAKRPRLMLKPLVPKYLSTVYYVNLSNYHLRVIQLEHTVITRVSIEYQKWLFILNTNELIYRRSTIVRAQSREHQSSNNLHS